MDMISRSGIWRVPAFYYSIVFGYPYTKTKLGTFRCADMASAYQMWGGWEKGVKAIISSVRDGLFLDVGANIGYYSVMAGKNRNHVIAVEPNPVAYACLVQNLRMNNIEAETYNRAAWSVKKWLRMRKGRHTDLTKIEDSGADILGITLDELLNGRVPSLIKLDAEGSEPSILRGAPDTLKARPPVIFEALNEYKFQDCRKWLLGYRIERIDATNYVAR